MLAEVAMHDGVPVRVFAAIHDPARPTVVFVNAVGMPLASAERLMPGITAAGFNYVSWELRGSPGPWSGSHDLLPATHVADAECVISSLNIGQVHLLGWCTGAAIALFVAGASTPERIRSLTVVDGAFLFDGVPGAPLGNAMYAMCGEIVADPGSAVRYHELTRPHGREAAVLGLERAPDLVPEVTYPYRHGVEALERFAGAIRSVTAYDPVDRWRRVRVPTLVTARRDDQLVSYRNSVRAAEHAADARLRLYDAGGHYALFTDEEALNEITRFVRTVADRPAMDVTPV